VIKKLPRQHRYNRAISTTLDHFARYRYAAGVAHPGFLSGQPEPGGTGAWPAFRSTRSIPAMASAQTLGIPHQNPCHVDMRGRLEVRGGEIHVFPVRAAAGKLSPPSLGLPCPWTIPWAIGESLVCVLQSTQKFLQRPAAGKARERQSRRFFSGATWKAASSEYGFLTGTDGHTRLFQMI